jgi:two-component system, cell cycle response regulator
MSPPAKEAGVPTAVGEDETRAMSDDGNGSLAGSRARLQATLKILTGLEAGRTYIVSGHQTLIGRSTQCDLSIDNEELSRRHCRVFRSGDTFVVEDLGSRNGTLIDGAVISFAVPLREGTIIRLAAGVAIKFSTQDELEVKAEQRLYESAVLDALTGVHNRRHLDQRLRAEVAFATRHRSALSVLLLDIDHFKKINDTLGHPAGDAALRALGELLLKTVRTEDIVARYGGEEFAIVLEGTDRQGAFQLAERIRQEVEQQSFASQQGAFQATLSIGVASYPDDAREKADIIARADQSLYAAKHGGRNRTVCFSDIERAKPKLAAAK